MTRAHHVPFYPLYHDAGHGRYVISRGLLRQAVQYHRANHDYRTVHLISTHDVDSTFVQHLEHYRVNLKWQIFILPLNLAVNSRQSFRDVSAIDTKPSHQFLVNHRNGQSLGLEVIFESLQLLLFFVRIPTLRIIHKSLLLFPVHQTLLLGLIISHFFRHSCVAWI